MIKKTFQLNIGIIHDSHDNNSVFIAEKIFDTVPSDLICIGSLCKNGMVSEKLNSYDLLFIGLRNHRSKAQETLKSIFEKELIHDQSLALYILYSIFFIKYIKDIRKVFKQARNIIISDKIIKDPLTHDEQCYSNEIRKWVENIIKNPTQIKDSL